MWLKGLQKTTSDLMARKPRLCAFVAGVCMTLGFAPFFLWPLALASLVAIFSLVYRSDSLKHTFYLSWLFGIGYFATSIYWIPRAFYMDFGSWVLALGLGVPALLALSSYMALFVAVPAMVSWRFRCYKNFYPFIFAVLWCAGEWLRSYGLLGFPWNLAGYIWAGNDVVSLSLLQMAVYGKIWLVNFCVLFSVALFFRFGWKSGVSFLVMLGLVGALRFWAEEPFYENVDVALIQPNVPQREKWDLSKREGYVQELLDMSFSSKVQQADLIVWPETSLPFVIGENDRFLNGLSSYLRRGQVLLASAVRYETGHYYNSVFVVTSDGVVDVYDKKHLVPFGEYVPFRKYLPSFVDKLAEGRQDYSVGKKGNVLDFDSLSILPLICFEAVLPDFVQKHFSDQRVLVAMTNDAWFSGTTAPYQHLAMAKVRAVELRKPMLRVANTGISAVIDSKGRIIDSLPFDKNGVLLRTIILQP